MEGVKMTVKKTTMIGELVEKYPEAVEVLSDYGMQCIGCRMGMGETIEQGALTHGLSKDDLKELLRKMNEKTGTTKKTKGKEKRAR